LLPIISAGLLLAVGCSSAVRPVSRADLNSPDPTVRFRAIKWAGERQIIAAVPYLIDLLEHEDMATRYYAILALKQITGTDLEYDFKADPFRRAKAVRRWRQHQALVGPSPTPEKIPTSPGEKR